MEGGRKLAIEFGIVGCGGMGLRHALGYIELCRRYDSLVLGAVCDKHEEAANHVAGVVEEHTGHRPAVYTDLGVMLRDRPDLAAIDIVTDTRMHHVFALQAFDADVHVLTEKPMGLTMKACRQMQVASERTGKILSIAEQYRRDPMNRLTKALIEAGVIGEPHFAMKVGMSGGSSLMHNTGWRALKSRAGSIIIEQGVHEADLLLYFLGDVETVYAQTGLFTKNRTRGAVSPNLAGFYGHRVEDQFLDQDVVAMDQEDTAIGVLKFASGVIGQLSISNASHGYSAGMNSIHGSSGTILLPSSRTGRPPQVFIEGSEAPLSGEQLLELVPNWELDEFTATMFDGDRRMSSYEVSFDEIDRVLIAVEMQEFANSISNGVKVEVDAAEGMKALGIAYGLLESGASRMPVKMSEILDGSVDCYQREIDESAGI
jgi:predicted dehydrogenase